MVRLDDLLKSCDCKESIELTIIDNKKSVGTALVVSQLVILGCSMTILSKVLEKDTRRKHMTARITGYNKDLHTIQICAEESGK